ncbi:hypothetical protein BS78_09G176700 [Paspalum vaginatum]|nr:hypothetical protein BS78_09G176700 [Paspalum vaginatum]
MGLALLDALHGEFALPSFALLAPPPATRGGGTFRSVPGFLQLPCPLSVLSPVPTRPHPALGLGRRRRRRRHGESETNRRRSRRYGVRRRPDRRRVARWGQGGCAGGSWRRNLTFPAATLTPPAAPVPTLSVRNRVPLPPPTSASAAAACWCGAGASPLSLPPPAIRPRASLSAATAAAVGVRQESRGLCFRATPAPGGGRSSLHAEMVSQ